MISFRLSCFLRTAWITVALCLAGSAEAASLSDYYSYQTITMGSGGLAPKPLREQSATGLRYSLTLDFDGNLISPAFSILAQTGNGIFDVHNRPLCYDLGLLYGRRLTARAGYLYAGAGVAYVHAEAEHLVYVPGYYHSDLVRVRETYRIGGIPWDLAAALTPGAGLGILFEVYGDINRRQSWYGWGIGLHLDG